VTSPARSLLLVLVATGIVAAIALLLFTWLYVLGSPLP
jgi:hypothetical protein